ncbi:hypothetical protein F2P45_25995 [Massilia sp. CCM 8733]|uniref:Uncharacterized protein n=1 Tax=Massilia mucilaginosa TaxID=2609282 RepID=A0ABX0P0E5_9BURK|nr:hypothetical protein [Massilia mucilaginosa]NHZ92431.1 hypothetical protein [Massilia mucilaginosa]
MTDPVKVLGQSRWKRVAGEARTPKRQMLRDKSVEASDTTVRLEKGLLVIAKKKAAGSASVILGGLTGNAYRSRLQKAIREKLYVKPEAQAPAVAQSAQSPDLAKFMSAFGSLKGKDVFGGDAVEFQREMREEWR